MKRQRSHSRKIRVVAEQFSVSVDDCVDRTYRFCALGYFIEVRNDCLLVGYGDIDRFKILFAEQRVQFFSVQFAEFIFVIGKSGMDLL